MSKWLCYLGGNLEWMQIVYVLPFDQYAMFLCLENGDPEDPVSQHGVLINMQANDPIQPGYYVILNPKGSPIEIPINEDILLRFSFLPYYTQIRRTASFPLSPILSQGFCTFTI